MSSTKKIILIMSASPHNKDITCADIERRALDKALRATKMRDLYSLEDFTACQVEDITDALDTYNPSILHFSGHGNTEGLTFQDHNNRSLLVPKAAFADVLRTQEGLELVVLSACYSSEQAELIADAVGCVIAMEGNMENSEAIDFSREFYRALGGGRDYRKAYSRAKAALGMTSKLRTHIHPPDESLVVATSNVETLVTTRNLARLIEQGSGSNAQAITRYIRRLRTEPHLLAYGRDQRYRTLLIADAWEIYHKIHSEIANRSAFIDLHTLKSHLGNNAPTASWCIQAWLEFLDDTDANASKSVVLAMLYRMHVEFWHPNRQLRAARVFKASEVKRYLAMAEWVPCYCKTAQCRLEWNFTGSNLGMHRGEPGTLCDALEFHAYDEQSELLDYEVRKKRAVERFQTSDRAVKLEHYRVERYGLWQARGLHNHSTAI